VRLCDKCKKELNENGTGWVNVYVVVQENSHRRSRGRHLSFSSGKGCKDDLDLCEKCRRSLLAAVQECVFEWFGDGK